MASVHKKEQEPFLQRYQLFSLSLLCILLLSLSLLLCISFFLRMVLAVADLALFSLHIPFALLVLGCVVAVPLTHAITGRRLHSSSWRFFQPLKGGKKFVLMQGVSWILFALAVVLACFWFYHFAQKLALSHEVVATASSAGVAAVLSQLLMVGSLFAFNPKQSDESLLKEVSLVDAFLWLRCFGIVAIFNNLQIIFSVCILAPFYFLPFQQAVALNILGMALYLPTYFGQPASSGKRKWDAFKHGFVMKEYIKWHQGRVIFTSDIPQGQRYLFAFAPHGVMPTSAMWLLSHPTWTENMLGTEVVLLASSVVHYIPFLRDVSMWLGTREITHKTFHNTLDEGKSVMVVPGGLSEVKFSNSKHNHIRILTRHKGFVRTAIKQGTPLVPVYSFGETRFLDTIYVPFITTFFYKKLRSPFPYFRGYLGFLQIPRPVKITVVIGNPILVTKNANPTDAEVDALHKEFYFAIKKLHTDYKEKADYSMETMQLVGLEADPRKAQPMQIEKDDADDHHYHQKEDTPPPSSSDLLLSPLSENLLPPICS